MYTYVGNFENRITATNFNVQHEIGTYICTYAHTYIHTYMKTSIVARHRSGLQQYWADLIHMLTC